MPALLLCLLSEEMTLLSIRGLVELLIGMSLTHQLLPYVFLKFAIVSNFFAQMHHSNLLVPIVQAFSTLGLMDEFISLYPVTSSKFQAVHQQYHL